MMPASSNLPLWRCTDAMLGRSDPACASRWLGPALLESWRRLECKAWEVQRSDSKPGTRINTRHVRIGAQEPSGDYDVVIETAGSESGLHRAVELARPGGTVIHVGVYGDISWPHGQAFTKEVGLRPSLGYASHHGRREFSEAADMLAGRPELGDILITHRYPMQDAPEAFRVAKDRSQGVFRVVMEF
jgi:threonine dehydrogenase-like Zn-dependent dehydrogenase